MEEAVQCSAMSKSTGQRCKAKTRKTFPCCWTHTIHAPRSSACPGAPINVRPTAPVSLRVKKSLIDGAGNGLFVMAPSKFKALEGKVNRKGEKLVFRKGDRIAEYTGRIYVGAKNEPQNPMYAMQIGKAKVWIDAISLHSGVARYTNDCCAKSYRKADKQGFFCFCTNCYWDYSVKKRRVFLQARKNIYDGDELYIEYGPEYWKEENLKQAKQSSKKK